MMQEAHDPTPASTPIAVFWTFLYVGATAMGGGAGAHIHEAVVRRRGWLTELQFLEGMTLARLMPGPVISNLASFLGAKLAGPRGALAATLGMILPGTCLMLGLAGAYFGARNLQNPVIEGALHGMAAAAVGVMTALVIQTAPAGLRVRGGLLIAAIVLVLSLVFHWSVLGVLAALFPVALLLNRPREEGNG
jgi:chromate transporter